LIGTIKETIFKKGNKPPQRKKSCDPNFLVGGNENL
jgi:hypothetical protein